MSGNRTAIRIVLALWFGTMVMSGFALAAEPTGDGFIRGFNRISGFIGWQAAGMILALIAWLSSRPLPKGELLRWLARAPGWWAILLFAGLAILIAMSSYRTSLPPPITDTPTAPVAAPSQ